ncbi:MAG: nucleotidyltransferase domain-containing protein [Patescibacteria group bacterium]
MIIPSTTAQILKDLGVTALYLFGSRALYVEGPLSDYDFGVLMQREGHARGDEAYQQLYDVLSPLCPRTQENDIIDIVFLRDAPLELRYHVIRYGRVIFDNDSRARLRFEEHTTLAYCDYRPLLTMFDQMILARI